MTLIVRRPGYKKRRQLKVEDSDDSQDSEYIQPPKRAKKPPLKSKASNAYVVIESGDAGVDESTNTTELPGANDRETASSSSALETNSDGKHTTISKMSFEEVRQKQSSSKNSLEEVVKTLRDKLSSLESEKALSKASEGTNKSKVAYLNKSVGEEKICVKVEAGPDVSIAPSSTAKKIDLSPKRDQQTPQQSTPDPPRTIVPLQHLEAVGGETLPDSLDELKTKYEANERRILELKELVVNAEREAIDSKAKYKVKLQLELQKMD